MWGRRTSASVRTVGPQEWYPRGFQVVRSEARRRKPWAQHLSLPIAYHCPPEGPAPYEGTGRKSFDLQVQSVVSGYCLQEFTLEVLYEAGEQQLQRTPANSSRGAFSLLLLSHTLADSPTKAKGPVSEVTDFLYWKKHMVSWYWNYTY